MENIRAPQFDGTQPCKTIGTELFFPNNSAEALQLKNIVKPICDSCGFQVDCLQWALDNNEVGIWAGTTEYDRDKLRRRQRRLLKLGA